LGTHQRDAVFTGVLVLAALVVRWVTRFPASASGGGRGQSQAWSVARTGRGHTSIVATLLLACAVAMITETASIGGTMVYQYGVGIHHVSFRNPLAHHK
jgi:cytochrome b561